MPGPDAIFDTALFRRRLARAARAPADFLLARLVEDIGERLDTVKRRFGTIADIGTPTPRLSAWLRERWPEAAIVRVAPLPPDAAGRAHALSLVGDAEQLPIASGSLDLATSALALQSANDLPGALAQIRQALRPDGLFLGALLGGRTLFELRQVLTETEADLTGGASPRVAPFADVRDLGGLLQRAGFALPVADSETLTVRYDHMFALMADLRAMGATNTLVARDRRPPPRDLFPRAAALYHSRFADPDGRLRATFEIVALSGWAPHESQQKPARRGSGQISLAEALDPTRNPRAQKT